MLKFIKHFLGGRGETLSRLTAHNKALILELDLLGYKHVGALTRNKILLRHANDLKSKLKDATRHPKGYPVFDPATSSPIGKWVAHKDFLRLASLLRETELQRDAAKTLLKNAAGLSEGLQYTLNQVKIKCDEYEHGRNVQTTKIRGFLDREGEMALKILRLTNELSDAQKELEDFHVGGR